MDKTRASLSRSARRSLLFSILRSEKTAAIWDLGARLCGINNANKATHGAARGWTGAASACISCSCHFCFPPSIVETLQRGRPCAGGGGGLGPEEACGHVWMPAPIVLRVLHLPPRRSCFIDTPAAAMSTPPQDGSACNYNWGANAARGYKEDGGGASGQHQVVVTSIL